TIELKYTKDFMVTERQGGTEDKWLEVKNEKEINKKTGSN
ncbi:hypothetical protein LCGC14_2348860, partial [marine sediment metagenome]